MSERKNLQLNICLSKSILIRSANNTALILNWKETTWLLTHERQYGPFHSRPEVWARLLFESSQEIALTDCLNCSESAEI